MLLDMDAAQRIASDIVTRRQTAKALVSDLTCNGIGIYQDQRLQSMTQTR